jgi:lipopolysaccharide export system protein LptA
VYTGSAQLWQGDTTIKGSSITLDDKNGDLAAEAVATRTMLIQRDNDNKEQRVVSVGNAKVFNYKDSVRRATYAGEAHLTGPQGELTASRIDLYLKESGDEIEHLTAFESVGLREQNQRKTTGNDLTYFGADERYVVAGAPVKIVDQCGRETTGRTLTFFKATDRIVVDGKEQGRTQSKGKSQCP